MGELARSPTAPKLPETPLELLTPRPGEGYSEAGKLSWPVMGAIGGITTFILSNVIRMRPVWSGIHMHIIGGVSCSLLAIWLRDIKYADQSETDAVMKHYVSLHPEDFPPFERKRWSEVYKPFRPYR